MPSNARTKAQTKSAAKKPQETAEALAAELADSPEQAEALEAALTAPEVEFVYGITQYGPTKHYVQAHVRTPLTLCTGTALKELARPDQAKNRKLCAKCAKSAENNSPVTVDAVNWAAAAPEMLETTPVPEAEPVVEAAQEQPEVQQPVATEAAPVVVVLPSGTKAQQVREFTLLAAERGFFSNREQNRYRRALTRMGAAYTGIKDEADPKNLAYDITALTDGATLDAHMIKFSKLWPELDKSTLKGYVRNLGRVLVAYSEYVADPKAWDAAHPVKASK